MGDGSGSGGDGGGDGGSDGGNEDGHGGGNGGGSGCLAAGWGGSEGDSGGGSEGSGGGGSNDFQPSLAQRRPMLVTFGCPVVGDHGFVSLQNRRVALGGGLRVFNILVSSAL